MKVLLGAAILLLASAPTAAAPRKSTSQPPHTANAAALAGALGYYVGTWEGHGETKGGPFGKAGKLSSRQTCKWFTGHHHVICQGEERGPTGERHFLNILAYDEGTKAYTEYSVSSFGEAEYDRGGSLVDGKLTFIVNQDAGGKPAKFRYTETHLSPVLYAYNAQVSVAGAPWTVLAEGKITKVRTPGG